MSAGSLRRRLLAFSAVTVVAALLAAGGALILVFENNILKRVEQELEVRWSELARTFALSEDGAPQLGREPNDPRYHQPYGMAYWQISEDGRPLLRSRSLWDEVLDTASTPAHRKAGAFEIEGPNRSELYVIERVVTIQTGASPRDFTLAVALDHADVAELRMTLMRDVGLLLALIALVLIAGAWLQVRFGLSPLRDLRASLFDVREGRAERFRGRFADEVQPLVDDLNTLLDRQDELVRKGRASAGALAHGLKTPLTVMSGDIGRLERQGYGAAAAALREQWEAIRVHVERELAKARTHGAVRRFGVRTQVRPLVERLVRLMERSGGGPQIEWLLDIPDGVLADMEGADLAEVVGNIIDNARKWAKKRVTISSVRQGGRLWLSVADDGPGVPADRREAVLQYGVHFAGNGHVSSGLGLAIARDILAEYGFGLWIEEGEPGCRVRLQIGAGRAADDGSGATQQTQGAAAPARL